MKNEMVVNNLEQLETEILQLKNEAAQRFIEIGKRLILAKEQLKHGEWGKWLEEKVDFSQRSANQLMRVAKEFQDSQAISNLEGTKITMLLDVPLELRDKFMEDNNLKNMTTREMREAINDLKKEDFGDEFYTGIHEVMVSDLKDFPKHEKYFPSIVGKSYMNFLLSVERNGIIEPICITKDKMIVCGHQRVRACKDLGIEKIKARYFNYDKSKGSTYDEQLKRRFCGGNCSTGQMDLYTNAKKMLGLEDGVIEVATDIIKRNSEKSTFEMIKIGEDLREVKKELGNDRFLICLKDELGIGLEMANIYIELADEYNRTNQVPTKLAEDLIEEYVGTIYKMIQ